MEIRRAYRGVLVAGIGYLCFAANLSAQPGLDSPTPVGAYLDGVFPQSSPGSAMGDWIQVDYYPGLNFVEPIRIVEHPTENKLIIVGKDGAGWSVTHEQGSTVKSLFFDIGPIMHGKAGAGEGGISDVVFHPEFGDAGSDNSAYVYISYRWEPNKSGTFDSNPVVDGYNRISRFSVISNQVDLGTELPLITQFDQSQNHIGGDMFFGDDGFLYISAGDEGNCCNREISTQRLDGGLWSGLLRIDVDQDPTRSHPIRRQPNHPAVSPTSNGPEWPVSFTQGYFIPNDNPFVDESGANLEEFYSIGLRHPWVVSSDAATGNIWAADVGQNAREEINLVNKGDNHQWAYREGTTSGVIPPPAEIIGNEVPPIFEYPHSVGQAVIGAGVYRGDIFPELVGKYLFSDFISGRLWTATATGAGYTIDEIGFVTNGFPNGINSYLLDSKGNILLAKTSGSLNSNGSIQMLARSGSVPPAPEPPQFLSQTGAFANLSTLEVHPGCIPYDLNVPFWSDAALKSRWMCVPNDGSYDTVDEKIGFSPDDDWTFPVGSVLIKHFEMQTDTSNPASAIRLETRFVVHSEEGYYGVTYRWDEFGVDAELLTTSEDVDLTIQTPMGPIQQTWHFPSRNECLTCHSSVSGGALGPNTRQLNGTAFYPETGRTSNQLETLNSLGVLSPGIADLEDFLDTVLTSTPTADEGASLSARARSYIDSNCGYCHRPNGVRANFDARLTTPLNQQGLINGILSESFGVEGEAVIVPGSLPQSILFQRASSAGESFSMPPLAKDLVDTAGMSVIQDWILMLAGFDVGNDTTSGGSFIDGHHPSLYINEQDVFVQDNEPGTINVDDFKFFAQRLGNPITPVVVRVDGDNDFTVLAIGTTRTQSEYTGGENIFPFDDSGAVTLSLSAGEKVATGFMDSYPDGSGWGEGTVIPAEAGSGAAQDEIWALLPAPLMNQTSQYQPDRDTPVVVLGESIAISNAGKALQEYLGLRRSYKFAITFSMFEGNGEPPPVEPPPTIVVNGSFELPVVSIWEAFAGPGGIPGWTITSGTIEVDRAPWPAAEGLQSIDLNGSSPGALEQIITGLQPGSSFTLEFEYALHSRSSASRSAEVLIDDAVSATVVATTAMKPPNYQTESIALVVSGDGQVKIGFRSLSAGGKGVVIDNVRLLPSGSGGGNGVGPVSDTDTSVNEVNESAAVATLVGVTAFADDPDVGDSVSYSLTSNPNSAFTIDSGTGVVSVSNPGGLDFETASTMQIVVQATSTDSSSSSASFDITIIDDPDEGGSGSDVGPVSDTDTSVNEVNESAAVATLVGVTAFADDPDVGDSVSYSLTSNPNSAFTIDSGTGVVSVSNPGGLDFETASTMQIVVQATSTDSSSSSASFDITIIDDPDEPQMPEVVNGSFELPVVSIWEAFAGPGGIPGWTITSGTIEVDRAPWPAAEGLQSIDLNGSSPGALEQIITGLQPGSSFTLEFEYALHSRSSASRSAEVLIDDAVSATVVATTAMKPPNYQTESIALVVSGDGQVKIGFRSLSAGGKGVVIDNVRLLPSGSGGGNGVGPVSDTDTSVNEVNESAAVATLVGVTAFADDPDVGDSVSYSLTSNPNSAFTIDSGTGVVSVSNPGGLDFETASTMQIVVQATSTDSSSSSASFDITIIDDPDEGGSGSDVGPVSDTDTSVNEVNESAAVATLVGVTAFADDPDVGDSVSYSLTSNPNSAFTIDSGTGVVSVSNPGGLDFETASTMQIVVQATSTDSSSSSASFDITIIDDPDEGGSGSDVGPVSDTDTSVNEVNESAAVATLVGVTAFADDPDVGDSVSYSLTSNPNSAFTIDSGTGVVSVSNPGGLDFETASTMQIVVQATSTDSSSSSASFDITIIDDPDEPQMPEVVNGSFELPVVSIWEAFAGPGGIPGWTITSGTIEVDRAPWPAAEGLQSIDLNGSSPGALEQIITGLQPGSSFTLEFEYALHSRSSASRSAEVLIDDAVSATVVATTAMKPPNYQTESIALVVSGDGQVKIGFRSLSAGGKGVVIDNVRLLPSGSGGGNGVGPVSDTDTSVNEVNESAAVATLVGVTAFADDPDVGDSVSYSLTSNPNSAFTIDSGTGVVSVSNPGGLDFETASTMQIVVQATSTDSSSSSASFDITIIDDPDEGGSGSDVGPVSDTDTSVNEVNESAAVATLVGVTAFADDPDVGDSVSYSLTSNPNSAFTIDSGTGVVSVSNPGGLDFETASTMQIVVQATSTDSSSSSASFDITIIDDPDEAGGILNGGFESGLANWSFGDVAITSSPVFEGDNAVDLQDGFIEQTIGGFSPGNQYVIALAYRDKSSAGGLADAAISVNGTVIGEIHTAQRAAYLNCNGFEFTADSQGVTLRIESLESNANGALIDNVRVIEGRLPPPPSAPWNSLLVMNDPRGGRQLVNGGFESPIGDHLQDPDNSGPQNNPHVCGGSLPGWRVMQENVDVISQWTPDPEGDWVLDTGGHGPGGIAQTVTGLAPNATYTLSFWYARHSAWGTQDMTGEVLANGVVVETLVRTNAQKWNSGGYEIKEIDMTATSEGHLTIEIRSTTNDKGGNIIYDDIRLIDPNT